MADRPFIMSLARVLIAAAWADGELSPEEVLALKDLLFRLPHLSEDDWDSLQMYLEEPVNDREAQQLIDNLLKEVDTKEEKQIVREALVQLLQADDVFSNEEQRLYRELMEAVDAQSTGLFARFKSALGAAIGHQRNRVHTEREEDLQDYLYNIVYHDFQQHMEKQGRPIRIPEAEARKLCLAAALMARVAYADLKISQGERLAIRNQLSREWELGEEEAEAVAEMSCRRVMQGIEISRLCRGFYELTNRDERLAFIRTLFAVANSAGKTSNAEIDHIRQLAAFLHVPHKDYIEAKLTISDADRGGL